MPKSDEFASVMLEVEPGSRIVRDMPTEDKPFRILVMGDFSGRASRGEAPTQRLLTPVVIDRDNFDEVMAGMGVELHLGGMGDKGVEIQFGELDDFHPDRIYGSLDVFRRLRGMRERLKHAVSGSEATAEARSWAGLEGGEVLPSNGRKVIDDILEASETDSPSAAAPTSHPLQDFIRRALAPYLAPREDPQVPELAARLDEAAGELMRAILHCSEFQALEAAWRALFLMIRRLETNSLLKVYVLDLTREELAADLAGGALEDSALYRLLVEEGTNNPIHGGWAVAAGHYSFGRSGKDASLLRTLGRLARMARTPFLAEGDLEGGAGEECGIWGDSRRLPEASWLGLALPRFLLRLPYGEKTDQTECFRFEEIPGVPQHGDYLWGNPAMACAYLMGEEFSRSGWRMRQGTMREIGGMPLHVYDEGGESQLRPCVETAMTSQDAEWALDEGYMPLVWLRGEDSIRLVRFQSIADPQRPLSGRWE